MALVTGYDAMAGRLWTTLPTFQISHTVITTLVAVKILCKCPTLVFLCCVPGNTGLSSSETAMAAEDVVLYRNQHESALGNYIRTSLVSGTVFSTGKNEWTGV
jgi:hypothetical protein